MQLTERQAKFSLMSQRLSFPLISIKLLSKIILAIRNLSKASKQHPLNLVYKQEKIIVWVNRKLYLIAKY